MGAITDAMVVYAQPLLEQLDGTPEDVQWALSLATLCFTMAQVSDDVREEMLTEMRKSSDFSDDEFLVFLNDIIYPMIERQREMFPQMNARARSRQAVSVTIGNNYSSSLKDDRADVFESTMPEPRPYAPCSCGSGLKYKFCCRIKPRAR